MHELEKEAIQAIVNNLKGSGDSGMNIAEAASTLVGDGYDKSWVQIALQEVAKLYNISASELSDYLIIEAAEAQKSSN